MNLVTRLTLMLERAVVRRLMRILAPLDLEDVELPTDD